MAKIRKKGEDVELPTFEFDGFVLREGCYDKDMLREIPRSYGSLLAVAKNKIVLDIGAHVGTFTELVRRAGAASVIAVEPEEFNFELLEINAKEAIKIQAACIGSDKETITLYRTTRGASSAGPSIHPTRAREATEVKAVNFWHLIEKYKPSLIKIDCEGAEYDFLLEKDLPDFVTNVAMEIHLMRPGFREKLAPQLISKFKDWKCLKEPKIGEKNWFTIGAWERL